MANENLWDDDKINHLIDLWEESFTQLRKYGRNSVVTVKIAEQLNAANKENEVPFTSTDVKEKIDKLRKQYK